MYDAIIVGARCAGASTAMLLARRGQRVLMVDRDHFPSDMTASTHFIWCGGAERLHNWGVLKDLERTNCPAQHQIMMNLGGLVITGRASNKGSGFDACYAPRRMVLDSLLVEKARAAGCEVREGASVETLLFDGERVEGVRIKGPSGEMVDERSRVVVGADGMNSTIARLVGAQEYNEHPRAQQTFYSYFEGVTLTAMENHPGPGRMGFAWTSNAGVVVAGVCCRIDESQSLRADTANEIWKDLDSFAPQFSERLQVGTQVEPWRMAGTRSVMRKASGPGWALAGDAGMVTDPITASGISNAFCQAEMIAAAIAEGLGDSALDSALERYGTERDERLGPHYEFTAEMAKLDPEPPAEILQMLMALPGNQQDIDDYFGVFAQTVPVAEFFAPANMQRIIEKGAVTAAAGA